MNVFDKIPVASEQFVAEAKIKGEIITKSDERGTLTAYLYQGIMVVVQLSPPP